jgi:hypothetical protein
VLSWIIRKINKEFERLLERSFQRTADRINARNLKEFEAMYDRNKVPYINEIGADKPSKGNIVDERV